ncbi:DUF5684 domain-containing protein [Geobacter sp.]|uniref:DUF5684 domain-containing protein n=1 Tax=Geobacter sp. TaxID=46610 RepID=UPI0026261C4C|nr:DUF5684 domain-containing protein [Geobacter sp.]
MANRFWAALAAALAILSAVALHAATLRSVHLTDGSVIQCQSVWKNDGKVMILVNRDTLVELPRDEVDLKKTFGKPRRHPARKKMTVAVPATERDPSSPAVKPVQAPPKAEPPAPSGAERPSPAASVTVATPAVPSPEPAPVPAPPAPAAKVSVTPHPVSPAVAAVPALFGTGFLVGMLLFAVLLVASFWKVYEKAGEAGWKSLVPFYNLFILVKIAGKPWWWFLLLFVPLVNVAIGILLHLALAARFGKGPLFGLGLALFGFVFFPILAFDKSVYR